MPLYKQKQPCGMRFAVRLFCCIKTDLRREMNSQDVLCC